MRLSCVKGHHSREIRNAVMMATKATHFPQADTSDLVNHVRTCPWCLGIIGDDDTIDCKSGEMSGQVVIIRAYLDVQVVEDEFRHAGDNALADKVQRHIQTCPHCKSAWRHSSLRATILTFIAQNMPWYERVYYQVRLKIRECLG